MKKKKKKNRDIWMLGFVDFCSDGFCLALLVLDCSVRKLDLYYNKGLTELYFDLVL